MHNGEGGNNIAASCQVVASGRRMRASITHPLHEHTFIFKLK